jgi:O-antigen ligase
MATYPFAHACVKDRHKREEVTRHSSDRTDAPGWSAPRVLLIATLTLATSAFGAVQAWAWGATIVLTAAALVLWALSSAPRGVLPIVWTPLYLPAGAFLLLGFVQYFGHTTADPISTHESLVKLTADLIVFFLATQLWSARSRPLRQFALSITVLTCALALFALLQFFCSPTMIYGFVKPRWGGWVFGPYVNHNHYAGLMEMLTPVAICYLISLWMQPRYRRRVLPAAFPILIALASIPLSGSRGGLLSLLVEIILLALILWRRLPGARRQHMVVAGALSIVAAGAMFLWLDPGQVSQRLRTVADVHRAPEATLGERRLLTHDALGIFADHPWLGTGLGSFATVYPRYRSFASDLEWDHAHNDYAEALAETGIVGGVLILAALGLFAISAFSGLRQRLESTSGWIRLGAALGCCGLLIHSLADFNLHIPANAAWFSLCAGIAVGGCKTEALPAQQRAHISS